MIGLLGSFVVTVAIVLVAMWAWGSKEKPPFWDVVVDGVQLYTSHNGTEETWGGALKTELMGGTFLPRGFRNVVHAFDEQAKVRIAVLRGDGKGRSRTGRVSGFRIGVVWVVEFQLDGGGSLECRGFVEERRKSATADAFEPVRAPPAPRGHEKGPTA